RPGRCGPLRGRCRAGRGSRGSRSWCVWVRCLRGARWCHGRRAAACQILPRMDSCMCVAAAEAAGATGGGIGMSKANPGSRCPRMPALLAGGLLLLGCGAAAAQVVHGRLELQWGDPAPAPAEQRPQTRLLATLVTDDGVRIALDPAQARRAAGDLYALSNRRVAVAFAGEGRGVLRQAAVEVIVPADPAWQRAPAIDASGRVAAAGVEGTTRWVTLACKFSDIAAEQKTREFFTSQYGYLPGQLGHYWIEVSYGKIDLTGSQAHGWFTLPSPRDAYVTTVDGEEKADLDKLFTDCAAAADPTVDFSGVQGINMMFN